jgi:RNA polymerase sigma-70 factor (ECF subfamily)
VQDQFHDQVLGLLPRLRLHALALTRNHTAADDLVQDAMVNALAARDSFQPGTNLAAWMHTIMRNQFISVLRKRRTIMVDIDDVPTAFLAIPDGQESRLVVKELNRAMGRLPPKMREALVMVAVLGMSYEAVAAATACAVGTAKTRVFRAREHLRAMLLGEGGPRLRSHSQRPSRRRSEALLAAPAGP